MKNSQLLKIVLLSVISALLANILFGRYLTAKISTLPLLNRWKILSPQAPIVINTREEVRVNETKDILLVLSSVKPKLSAVIIKNPNQVSLAGTAVNLTSDGLFLTSKTLVDNAKPENLFVRLDDGTVGRVDFIFKDPATDLAILKAKINNVPVANIGESQNLVPGQKLIAVQSSLLNFSPKFQSLYVSVSQKNHLGVIRQSDFPTRSFSLDTGLALADSAAIVNMNSEVVGLTVGGGVISGDIIKDLVGKYLSTSGKVSRPSFGFKYKLVGSVEAKLLSLPVGAKITEVAPGSPAQKSELQVNDIITAVDEIELTEDKSLEELLQKYHPGDQLSLKVSRGKENLNVILKAGELK